jgi:hypothetical protein
MGMLELRRMSKVHGQGIAGVHALILGPASPSPGEVPGPCGGRGSCHDGSTGKLPPVTV